MKASELYNDIKNYCIKNASEEIVKKYSRYFKGGYIGYGVSNEMILSKVKEYKNQSWYTLNLVYETCRLLVKEEKYEFPNFALLLLNQFSKELNYNSFKEIEHWFSVGINNWAHTDGIAQYFFPVFWKKEIIQLEDLSDWRNSQNKFQRRCVPVSMIKLLKHTTGYQKMVDFIDPMMTDPEREVHQGLG